MTDKLFLSILTAPILLYDFNFTNILKYTEAINTAHDCANNYNHVMIKGQALFHDGFVCAIQFNEAADVFAIEASVKAEMRKTVTYKVTCNITKGGEYIGSRILAVMSSGADDVSAFLKAELEQAKKELPTIENVKLIAAVPALVRAEIKKTEHKQVAVTCMFQPSYPDVPLVTELRSKSLADKFLDGLAKVCDTEARKLKGKTQVIHVIRFVKTFIEENPLCVCSDEISAVKRLLVGDKDEVKLKQKTSEIVVKVHQEQYFIHFRIYVPDDYPLVQIVPEITEHNFPAFLLTHFRAQAAEVARRCAQPPLKKNPKDPPFVPSPSLLPASTCLIECVKKYPLELCQLCHEKALPLDPVNESALKGKPCVEKIYCGHMFHLLCLNKYMRTPPFAGGKQCPSCGKQIFHDKWKVSSEVMETRWAHKQAKQRELEEVVDFME